MFFKIGPKDFDEYFSYMIIKHPVNSFERDVSTGRKIVANFDDDLHYYKGYVENDPIQFLSVARGLNMSNYIHTQLSSICPHNLKGFDECFRSALRKNFKEPIKLIDNFNAKKQWYAFIGPYPCNQDYIKQWFNVVNINVEIDDENVKHDLDIKDYEFLAYNIHLTSDDMTLSEFLQKIYLISYFLTIKKELVPSKHDRIVKFVSFCNDWIEKIEDKYRNKLINVLCGYRKENIKKFEHLIIESSDIDEDEKENKINKIDEILEREGLHKKRHNIICDLIKDNSNVIELGCGRNKLINQLNKQKTNLNILGIEINSKLIRRNPWEKNKNNISIKNSSILFPNIRESDLNPDFLICTEVIEHLEYNERIKLISLINKLYCPNEFVITVPNISYNKYIQGLLDENGNYTGELRHSDHKIEYTKEEFENEVVNNLSHNYEIKYIKLLEEYNDDEQPSFVIHGKRINPLKNKEKETQFKIYNNISKLYNPIHLPITNYEVRENELEKGYSSFAYTKNINNIFYLAPTMAPVDSVFEPGLKIKDEVDYIEHPISAINYYKNRGIDKIWIEEKYMGSRGQVLLFRNKEVASSLNFNKEIVVTSRGGFEFFDSDEDLYKIDWENIQRTMNEDFVIFDCEIMPWTYKAKSLIDFDFIVPGQCTYLSRKYGEYGNLNNSKEYLNILNSYTENDEFEIRIFNVLATGNIKDKKIKHFTNYMFMDRKFNYNKIHNLTQFSKNVRPVIFYEYMHSDYYDQHIINQWKSFTETENGEGFVFKPDKQITFTYNGYLIQPALKVRGKKYLHIIYGIDYLEKEYFEKVKNRSILRKRKMAVFQHELGINILRSFLNQNDLMTKKYISSFLGTEQVIIKGIDATL